MYYFLLFRIIVQQVEVENLQRLNEILYAINIEGTCHRLFDANLMITRDVLIVHIAAITSSRRANPCP